MIKSTFVSFNSKIQNPESFEAFLNSLTVLKSKVISIQALESGFNFILDASTQSHNQIFKVVGYVKLNELDDHLNSILTNIKEAEVKSVTILMVGESQRALGLIVAEKAVASHDRPKETERKEIENKKTDVKPNSRAKTRT